MVIALKMITFSHRKSGLMPDTTVFTVFSTIVASLIVAGSNVTMSAPDERSVVSIEFVRDVNISPNTSIASAVGSSMCDGNNW